MVTEAPQLAKERPVFPFTAIIGQEEMKLALILNVIDPRIGGVMIMGDRGTGKSTTIRAVADLLPAIQVVADDPFNSAIDDFELMSETVKTAVENNQDLPTSYKKVPMIDLPLGATEDRVCGTIDIEKALTEGVKACSGVALGAALVMLRSRAGVARGLLRVRACVALVPFLGRAGVALGLLRRTQAQQTLAPTEAAIFILGGGRPAGCAAIVVGASGF